MNTPITKSDLLQDIENELYSFTSFNVIESLLAKYQPMVKPISSDLKTNTYSH